MPESDSEVSSAKTPPPRSTHFECFDGLRAIAALSVVGMHLGVFSRLSPGSWLDLLTAHLNVGVTIFFLISGFLLYRPYAMATVADGRMPDTARYARRRVLRIVPAYWVALTVLGFWPGLNGVFTANWWWFYGFLQVYWSRTMNGGLSVSWSLCVEAAFYLVLPALALGLHLVGRRLAIAHRVRGPSIGLCLLGLTGIGFNLWTAVEGPIWTGLVLPAYLFWFSLGMGLALASARLGAREIEHAIPRWIAAHPAWCWAAALTLYLWICVDPHFTRWPILGSPVNTLKHVVYGVIALAILLPAVFGESARGWPRRLLASSPLQWMGRISYGIFLWHHPLLKALANSEMADWIPGHRFLGLTLLIVPISLAVGWLSYVVVEQPAMRLGSRKRPARAPEGPRPNA